MKATPNGTALIVYSVLWGERRVVVVEAPSREAVEELVDRHTCDQQDCDTCALFSIVDGVEGVSLKPVRVSRDGKLLSDFWESVLTLSGVGLVRWAFTGHLERRCVEPGFVHWPRHPE